jgi:hypothetical protein
MRRAEANVARQILKSILPEEKPTKGTNRTVGTYGTDGDSLRLRGARMIVAAPLIDIGNSVSDRCRWKRRYSGCRAG